MIPKTHHGPDEVPTITAARSDAHPDDGIGAAFRRLTGRPELASVTILAVLVLFLSATAPAFLTIDNLVWVVYGFSVVAIAAMGMLLVMVAGSIDLSIGSQMGLAAEVGGWVAFFHPGTPSILVFAAALASGVAFGLVNGVLVARLGLNAFIATLATSYVGRGVAIIVSQNRTYDGFSPAVTFIGQGTLLGAPVPIWLMIVLALFWSFVLGRTIFGRHIYATGGNPAAARLSGVYIGRTTISAFVISGAMAALAGFIFAARLGMVQQSIGVGYEMDVIAAAVIGGVSIFGGAGNIVGVVIGAAVMAVIRNGLVLLQIGAIWQQVVTGAVIVLAVVLDRLRGGSWFWRRRAPLLRPKQQQVLDEAKQHELAEHSSPQL